MRAHIITTITRPRRSARRVFALGLGICALAIPATASGYSSVNAVTGGSEQSSGPSGGSDYASPNAIAPPSSGPSGSGGSTSAGPGTSLNATVGPPPSTADSPSPAGTADGFDWGDAALGAGAAMALVALGGAVFLTVRRPRPAAPARTVG